jgi:hypothetical protein
MNSTPDTPTGRRSWKNRTSLVTAAAVAGVLIAGTAAVAANIGILDSADDSAIGDLAATDELLPTADAGTTPSTTMAVTEVTAPPTTAAGPAVQQYDIEATGTVWVATTRSGIALDHVDTMDGWIAALSQNDLRSLQVLFTNGDRTVVFTAALGDDGSVIVDVTEPTTVVAATPGGATAAGSTSSASSSSQYDDDHDDHEYDSHEYEGADDDD